MRAFKGLCQPLQGWRKKVLRGWQTDAHSLRLAAGRHTAALPLCKGNGHGRARCPVASGGHASMRWACVKRSAQSQPMHRVTGGVGPHPPRCTSAVVHAHKQQILQIKHRLGRIHGGGALVARALPLPVLTVPLQHACRAAQPAPHRAPARQHQGDHAQPWPRMPRRCRVPPSGSDRGRQDPTAHQHAQHPMRTPHGIRHRWGVGGAHGLGVRSAQKWLKKHQMRLNTSVPLVPPKPKLFFTATSIFRSRAVLAQ